MPRLEHGEGEAERRVLAGLRIVAVLGGLVLVIEALGAWMSHSLALTVDAVHNVPDLLAFGVSWAALSGTRAGSSAEFTFGKHRHEVLAGLLNGALVLGAGVVFGFAAVVSLVSRTPFAGPLNAAWILLAVVPTLALRSVSLRVLARLPGRVRDLNLSSVLLHLASDLAIAGTLMVAAFVLIVLPGASWVDPLAALVIAALLVYESLPILREGGEVLTERTPRGLSVDAIERSVRAVPGVVEVHDVHVWAVCSTLVCLTAHVGVHEMSVSESMDVVRTLRERVESEFGIVHATFEIEVASEPPRANRPSPGTRPTAV